MTRHRASGWHAGQSRPGVHITTGQLTEMPAPTESRVWPDWAPTARRQWPGPGNTSQEPPAPAPRGGPALPHRVRRAARPP